MKVIPETCAH